MVQYNTTPAAGDILAGSQPILLANSQYLQTSIGTDHNFTNNTATTQDGYHKVIHFVNQIAAPGPIANTGQIYTKTANGSENLFYEDSSGDISQLTGGSFLTPNGYAYIGGLLFQWGQINPIVSSTTTVQNFNIPFLVTCLAVQLTLGNPGATGNAQAASIRDGTVGNTASFSYNYSGGSAYDTIHWFAIGF